MLLFTVAAPGCRGIFQPGEKARSMRGGHAKDSARNLKAVGISARASAENAGQKPPQGHVGRDHIFAQKLSRQADAARHDAPDKD